jgi:DNA-binding transcriptional MerR regulator
MEIQEIARRSGLAPRKVRYVLDQKLLPRFRGRKLRDLPGQPRAYSPIESYFIAVATILYDAGIKRQTIQELLQCLDDAMCPVTSFFQEKPSARQHDKGEPDSILWAIFHWADKPSYLTIGDGHAVQISLGKLISKWFDPRTCIPLGSDFQPRVHIRVQLDDLAERFRRDGDAANRKKRGGKTQFV